MAGQRLTDEKYWDKVWSPGPGHGPRRTFWKRLLLEPPLVSQLWVKLLPRHLPPAPARMAELGSAPGLELLQWRERYGYDVYGVDFSPEGIRQQCELFAGHGLDESHSLLADFLGQPFQDQHRDAFDVVCSRGLIEHFSDPDEAIAAHLRILKPGGMLFISIPNLTGVYRHLVPTSMLDVHNLEIMHLEPFRAMFERHAIEPLFCGYIGRLDLSIAYAEETLFYRLLLWMQILVNVTMRFLPVPDNGWTSPQLAFLGRKAG